MNLKKIMTGTITLMLTTALFTGCGATNNNQENKTA